MKVKDLIKELEDFNPEATIIVDNEEDVTVPSLSWSGFDGDDSSIKDSKNGAKFVTVSVRKMDEDELNCEK